MKWLSNFLKLRKQNDYVKIMFFIFLLGIYMLGSAIFNGLGIYHQLSTPEEYILSADAQNITQEAIKKITDTEKVDAASIQKQTNLTINITEDEQSFECYQISETYLKNVYHTESSGGMKTFYLTPKAYNKVRKKFEKNKNNNEIQSKYQMGDEETGIAKIVLLENKLFSDEELAFCQGNSAELSKDCEEIRAYITKKDLDGMTVKHLENLGYSIKNMEEVRETEYQLETNFLRIKYEIIIGVLCMGFNMIFWSVYKKLLKG